MKKCLKFISHIKNNICFNWREQILVTSLSNKDVCEMAIQNLPFLFHKNASQNISNLLDTIEHFNETTNILFVKTFRMLMCAMYRKTLNQNNKITCQEYLLCVDCDKKKNVVLDLQMCLIDETYNISLNKFWKTLLLSFLSNSNTVIRCEIIKNIPFITNHFHPDNLLREQILLLIKDKDEEVRIQCSKVLNYIVFEKDLTGDIQMIESFFYQMMNILCSTVNTSLQLGNNELQYTCLETIFNVGW